MNITIEYLVKAPTHFLPAKKHAKRNTDGDIIDVLKVSKHCKLVDGNYEIKEPISSRCKFAFLHVRNVPDIGFEKIRRKIDGPLKDFDVLIIANPKGGILKKRNWFVDVATLPSQNKSELISKKETNIDWNLVTDSIRRKLDFKTLKQVGF